MRTNDRPNRKERGFRLLRRRRRCGRTRRRFALPVWTFIRPLRHVSLPLLLPLSFSAHPHLPSHHLSVALALAFAYPISLSLPYTRNPTPLPPTLPPFPLPSLYLSLSLQSLSVSYNPPSLPCSVLPPYLPPLLPPPSLSHPLSEICACLCVSALVHSRLLCGRLQPC
jgi:hypothetical protein